VLERQIHRRLRGYVGYRATQAINGIGSKLAAILVAEIGDVTSRLPLRSDSFSPIASKLERRKTQAAGGARTKPVVTRAHRHDRKLEPRQHRVIPPPERPVLWRRLWSHCHRAAWVASP
jgi:transposase